MKIVLLVEGPSEKQLPAFLKRWLAGQNLPQRVGIQVVKFEGNAKLLRDVAQRTRLHLQEPDTLAVFGLLDLYGLPITYPAQITDRNAKIAYARDFVTGQIDDGDKPRFRQHFAVHEFEAWLLSDPGLFPNIKLPAKCDRPEEVNFDTNPAKMLDGLLSRGGGHGYMKTTMARVLLPRLDPNLVYQKCPNFKLMMDDMLAIARQSH